MLAQTDVEVFQNHSLLLCSSPLPSTSFALAWSCPSSLFQILTRYEGHLGHLRLSPLPPNHNFYRCPRLVHSILDIAHCYVLPQSRTWTPASHLTKLFSRCWIHNLSALPSWCTFNDQTHSSPLRRFSPSFLDRSCGRMVSAPWNPPFVRRSLCMIQLRPASTGVVVSSRSCP